MLLQKQYVDPVSVTMFWHPDPLIQRLIVPLVHFMPLHLLFHEYESFVLCPMDAFSVLPYV